MEENQFLAEFREAEREYDLLLQDILQREESVEESERRWGDQSRAILAVLVASGGAYIERKIPQYYLEGRQDGVDLLTNVGQRGLSNVLQYREAYKTAPSDIVEEIDDHIFREIQKFDAIIDQSVAYKAEVGKSVLDVKRIYTREKSLVDRRIAKGVINGDSIRKIRNDVEVIFRQRIDGSVDMNRFMFRGLPGKNGRTRRWSYDDFSDMMVKSARNNTFVDAQRDQYMVVGYRHIIVPHNPGTDDECQDFEGKILSLDGSDPRFPSFPELRAEGKRIYHPRCKHFRLIPATPQQVEAAVRDRSLTFA